MVYHCFKTAEAGGKEVHKLLQRARGLAVQAANDTLTKDDRNNINKEITEIKKEINNIANNTQFNNINLIDGSQSKSKEETFTAPYIGEFEITFNPTSEGNLGVSNNNTVTGIRFQFVTPADKDGVWSEVDIASTREKSLDNLKNKFYAIKSGSEGAPSEQLTIANMDMHIVGNKVIFTSEDPFTRTHDPANGIQGQRYVTGSLAELSVEYEDPDAGIELQTGANSNDSLKINISSMTTSALDITDIDVNDHSSASTAINKLDKAIKKVSSVKSNLGSYQNRLEHSLNNVNNYDENLTKSKSRISDLNMAKGICKRLKEIF
ncbi:flagellin/flagellar hook associated protein [Halobacteroides halobius DSM 5150]|uniref:Flagellin n=1 Tax=Halobacteroides halobius (strain ATCC 35273 / DSM 5150 / MD-1) TaxID=748449 RepID=L0K5Y3_HALHC|nr:flagellin [Halobacteroides halobius]AGB40416.1 flagellin/flagellar hook associated protein [Halobacteroides halobius DSM 5150]